MYQSPNSEFSPLKYPLGQGVVLHTRRLQWVLENHIQVSLQILPDYYLERARQDY